jgi:hypothetical protein
MTISALPQQMLCIWRDLTSFDLRAAQPRGFGNNVLTGEVDEHRGENFPAGNWMGSETQKVETTEAFHLH